MTESSLSSQAVSVHVQCPGCDYDLFGSALGCCPECGLPTSEVLIAEYQAGRRPASLEMPHRSLLRSLLQLCFLNHLQPKLARGFPPDRAKRAGRRIMGLGIVVFTLVNTVNLSFVVANKGVWLMLSDKGVAAPSAATLKVLPLFAVLSCATAFLSYALVRRSVLKRLRRATDLSADDAERVVAFTALWQIPVSVTLQVIYPLTFFFPGSFAGLVTAGVILLLGEFASLKAFQACISTLQGAALSRSTRSMAGRCANAMIQRWGYAWLVSVAAADMICGLHPASVLSP